MGSGFCDGCHADVDFGDAGLNSLRDDGVEFAIDGGSITTTSVFEIDRGMVVESALHGDNRLGVSALLGQASLV